MSLTAGSDDDDDATKAYAAVSAQLDQWTSPKKPTMNWRTYEEDATQWMETTMGREQQQQQQQERQASSSSLMTPQKRSVESSPETPVMSNSAKKDQPSPLNLSEIPSVMMPQTRYSDNDYRLYHDALVRHLQTKRSIQNRSDETLEKQSDIEYLSTLALDDILWSLLAKLRNLGLDALWLGSTHSGSSEALTRLSRSTMTTPALLIPQLYEAPLLMKRRKALLEWMHECFARDEKKSVRGKNKMWPDSQEALQHGMQRTGKITSLHPDAPLLVPESSGTPLYGNDLKTDEDLLQVCLQHILAGRLDEATKLCKDQGQPWRSAIWQGGRPLEIASGGTNNTVTMGNPERILWKSQCRKLARATKSPAEAAIYALLANDTTTALSNPCLRSWHKGLYVCLSSLLGRMEDELLHRFHAQVRQNGRVCPGSDYMQEEMEHLLATANAANFTEVTIFNTLEASPHAELRLGKSLPQRMIAAFVQGQNAVRTLLHSPWFRQTDDALLRTMVHLLLYLDSLPVVEVEGLGPILQDCILQYLNHLAGRPDLIKYATIYASMLDTPTLLSVYPTLLTSIQVPEERQLVSTQLKEFLPEGMDVEILQRVVRLVLADPDAPDTRKCQSIAWLCPHFYPQALECANELVRQLLLADKTSIVGQFLWDYFPTIVQPDNAVDTASQREYDAYLAYLEANTAFDAWKDCIMETPTTPTKTKGLVDMTKLSASEQSIARMVEQRRVLEQVRTLATKLVDVANAAQAKLTHVLQFEGGWLQHDDDDDDDEEEENADLQTLQSRLIPQVVFMAHNVYTETAKWLETMLQHLIVDGDNTITPKDAMKLLDDSTTTISVLSPLYWWQCAHYDLPNQVASEEYSVYDAFTNSPNDLKHFLELCQEVTMIGYLHAKAIYG